MIDTHCHLTLSPLSKHPDRIITDAHKAGLRGMITVATTSDDSQLSLKLAQQHDHLWCSAGVHPLYSDEPIQWDLIKSVAHHEKCVAWGELGLDNHYDHPPHTKQVSVLEEQLTFIQSCHEEGLEKPIIVHCRDSFDDLIDIFRHAPFDPACYVFPCFTVTPDDARHILDFGSWISFTGVVTFKNAHEVAEAACLVPDDRIMVETDAPFLTPEPLRKIRPNEPQYVIHTARFLAQIRGRDEHKFEQITDANAERFFGITLPPVNHHNGD